MKATEDFQLVIESLGKSYLKKVTQTLNQLIKNNNIQAIYNESHKLKGSGKTYGFESISLTAKELEKLCKKFLQKKPNPVEKDKTIINKKLLELKTLTLKYQNSKPNKKHFKNIKNPR